MQITRIEVRPRISASDRRLVDAAHQLGFASLTACIVTRLFFVSGTLSDDDAHRLASALLADPVTETYALGVSPTMDDARLVERTLLPGVTDAVADSLKHAAALIGVAVEQAATGERYELTGDLSDSDIGAIARGVLVNTVIHRVSFDTPIGAPFVAVQPTDDTVEIIPVRGLSSDALLDLSKDRRLSLDLNEMRAIQAYFEEIQRDPTDVELEMLAQTWSEHCVHKTFRAKITYTGPAHGAPPNSQPVTQEIDGLLKTYIRAATEQLAKPWVRSAFVDNAGIVAFDDAFDVAFKVETHNRPSALEPFGGANTGAGGVIRDVLGVSARPIANTDVLCFGLPDTPMDALPHNVLHPRRIIAGVIHGIEDYGNKMGIPTVNGAVHYHPGYTANPLVFAGCVGLIPRGSHRTEAQPGDLIVVIGGRTGRDGLRGATFSSMEMDTSTAQLSGGAVQIGNPIVEKQVQEVVLKARDASLYTAITDCGAGGLSSAVGEMGKDLGAHVQLADVPLKYPGLRPWEIWLSEAQERMVLAIPPANWDAFMAICAAHDVEAVAIGIFAPTGQLALFYGDKPVGSVSMAFLHGGIPRRELAAVWTAPSPPGPKTLGSETLTPETLTPDPSPSGRGEFVGGRDGDVRSADRDAFILETSTPETLTPETLTPDPSPSGRGEFADGRDGDIRSADRDAFILETSTPETLTPDPSPSGRGEFADGRSGDVQSADRDAFILETSTPETLTPDPSPSGRGEFAGGRDGDVRSADRGAFILETSTPETLTPDPSPSGRGEFAGGLEAVDSGSSASGGGRQKGEREFRDVSNEIYRQRASTAMIKIARGLRQRETYAEDVLWECLRSRRLDGFKFRRQHAIADSTFVVDFLCYEARLVIEVDGAIHKEQEHQDRDRQRTIESLGYTVIRFSNDDIKQRLPSILGQIAAYCHNLTSKHRSTGNPPLPEGEALGVRVNPSTPTSASQPTAPNPPLPEGEALGVRVNPSTPTSASQPAAPNPPLPEGEGLGVRVNPSTPASTSHSAALNPPLPEGEGLGVRVNPSTPTSASPPTAPNPPLPEGEGLGRVNPSTPASASQPAAPNPPLPEGEGLGVRVNPTLLSLLAHPTIRSKAEVVHRYDHEVGGGTAIKPLVGRGAGPGDAAVIVPLESLTPGDEGLPPRAVALSVGLCPQYTALDPYAMAWAAVDEAVRNAVAVGADPDTLTILDNFSWGNTQLPDRLGSLVRCAQGCYDAALAYGTPFISGKDSLNNEYVGLDGERHSIPGTLVISALGIVPDAHKTVTSDFKQAGDPIFLVGETEPDELGGSLYAELTGDSGIVPQPVRDALERYRLLHRAIRAGYVTAAHDCSEGGLSVALAEMCIGGQIGADITLDDEDEDALFCESQGRIIVAVDPAFADDFAALLGEHCARIGTVGGGALVIAGESITVDELAAAWGGVPLAPQPSSALTPAPSPSGRGESRTPDPEYLDIASQAMIYIARDLRQRQTRAEDVLWECLRDRRLGDLKFRRQHPIAHTTVVADFLCYEAQTIIDVDGPIHLDRQEADNDRQRDIEALGYTILRFSNEQIINQTRDTLASIAASCIQARNHTPKPSTNTAPDSPLPEGEGLGVRVSRSGVRVSRSGVRVSRSGVRASRLGVRASRLGVRVSRLGVRVPRLGVRVSRSGVRASRLGVRVSPLGVRVSRSGVRVSRSGVRASRSGVRASRSGGEGLYLRPKPILLLHATGTNRDRDAALACELAGGAPEIVTVNQLVRGERHVRDYAMLVIPGGFSYGDDLGAGVLWALDLRERIPGMEEFVRAGKPVLGICNGFQTLVKSGLLPGHAWDGGTRSVTLTYNAQGRFECRWVTLHANPVSPCLFTEGLDEPIHAPIAHGEGRVMVADEAARERLWADGLPALTYGGGAYPDNPNGSVDAIAGLCSPEGTVFGLMPHPENHVFPWQHPQRINGYSGLRLFENGIRRA